MREGQARATEKRKNVWQEKLPADVGQPLLGSGVLPIATADVESAQLGIEGLARKSEQLGGGSPIVLGNLECGFNAQCFDDVGRLANQLFQRYPTDSLRDLLDRTGQVCRYRVLEG